MIVTANAWFAVCEPASLTRTVKLNPPAAVGVPLMTPAEDRSSPGGKVPEKRVQAYGGVPPLAASV